MKKRIKAVAPALTAFFILFSVLPRVYSSRGIALSASDSKRITEEITEFILKSTDSDTAKSFLKNENHGTGMYDWYALGLLQNGKTEGFSSFASTLKSEIKNQNENPVEVLRRALLYCAVNPEDGLVSSALDNSANKVGIMILIFALHVLNNGGVSSLVSTTDIIECILGSECPSGGWSLNASVPDADVTAMTLQSLAPYYTQNAAVTDAVNRAVSVLSDMQNSNGGFTSFGNDNSESVSQTIIALCSLGINPVDDGRFIKNGNTLIDALLKFKLSDGSFEHIKNEGFHFKATEQAFLAFTALTRLSNGCTPLFILDSVKADKGVFSKLSQVNTKQLLLIGVCALGLIFSVFGLVFSKRKNKKAGNLFFVLFALSLVGIFLINTDFSSPQDYYNVTEATGENTVTVTLSVSCDTIKEYASENNSIPADGIILSDTKITLQEDATVYGCLIYAAKKYNLQIENSAYAGAAKAYISSIANIREFDFGNMSGWMFTVNGKAANVGCGEYNIKDGDEIRWYYTRNLGEDIK